MLRALGTSKAGRMPVWGTRRNAFRDRVGLHIHERISCLLHVTDAQCTGCRQVYKDLLRSCREDGTGEVPRTVSPARADSIWPQAVLPGTAPLIRIPCGILLHIRVQALLGFGSMWCTLAVRVLEGI
jgi:hypothetical protein